MMENEFAANTTELEWVELQVPAVLRFDSIPRRGAALVEVALALPFLLLVLAMIADFSRAYIVANAIDNAACQGVYTAALTPLIDEEYTTWKVNVEQSVRQALSVYAWYVPTQLTVTVPMPSLSNGLIDSSGVTIVEVKAEYFAQHLIRLPGLPQSYTIVRTIRMDAIN